MKAWKPFEDTCLHCGSEAEVFTDSDKPLTAYDGDEARCPECKCPGWVTVDSPTEAYIEWHDEPYCKCEWCKTNADKFI